MKKIISVMLALALICGSFAACGGTASSTASDAASTTSSAENSQAASSDAEVSETAAAGGEIIVNLASEPPEMNSVTTTSTGSMNVLRHIMDGLVILDKDDTPIPAIAESWDISDDKMTYTFHLRKDAKWSNGDPVVAADFIYAWNLLFTADTAAPYASTWAAYIDGAAEMLSGGASAEGVGYSAIDDYTIELHLAVPCSFILHVLAFPNFMPMNQSFYEEVGGLDEYGKEADAFCTNGAFTVEGWTHEDSFIIAKNPDYYDADSIKLDKITFLMIDNTQTAYSTFITGGADMIGLSADQVEMIKAEGIETLSYDDASSWYIEFGTQHTPGLNNAKVRKALTYAIDAEQFVASLVKNDSQVAYTLTPPAVSQGTFTEKVGKAMNREEMAADDYAACKAMFEEGLAEEGLTAADLKLTLIADEGDTAQKNCAFLQEQWKTHLGIEVTVEQMTYKNRLARMDSKDFDLVLAGWGPDYNDPMTFLDLWITDGGNNHTGWSNSEYDALIADAYSDADPDTRVETLVNAEKLLMEEMPIGPIYYRTRDYVTSSRLTGVVRTGFDDMNFRWASVVE